MAYKAYKRDNDYYADGVKVHKMPGSAPYLRDTYFDRLEIDSILKHDSRDQGKIFRREAWDDKTLMFSWHTRYEAYYYIDHRKYPEKILFKRGVSDGLSKVGESILQEKDIIQVKENKMANKKVNYVGNFNVVKAVYDVQELGKDFDVDSMSTYNFKIDPELTTAIGDIALVQDNSGGYFPVTIVEYLDNNIQNAKEVNMANAWVVNLIDMGAHKQRIKDTEELQFIKETLDRGLEQVEQIQKYQLLASLNPEMANAIKRMGELTGSPVIDVTPEKDDEL